MNNPNKTHPVTIIIGIVTLASLIATVWWEINKPTINETTLTTTPLNPIPAKITQLADYGDQYLLTLELEQPTGKTIKLQNLKNRGEIFEIGQTGTIQEFGLGELKFVANNPIITPESQIPKLGIQYESPEKSTTTASPQNKPDEKLTSKTEDNKEYSWLEILGILFLIYLILGMFS